MLPLDDLELEMEEVEGLVEVSTVGRGKSSTRASRASCTSAVVGAVASCCGSKYRSKWACCTLLILIIVVLVLYLTGEHEQVDLSNVDAKNSAPPKQEYVPPPPTAKPTTRATLSPTASPTKEKSVEKNTVSPPPTVLPTATPNEKKEEKEPQHENAEDKDTTKNAKKDANKKDDTKEETPEQDNETIKRHWDYSYPPTPYAVRTENPPAPNVLEEYKTKWGTKNGSNHLLRRLYAL